MPDPTLDAKITADASGFVKAAKGARDALGRFVKAGGKATKAGEGLGKGTRKLGLFTKAAKGARVALAKTALAAKATATGFGQIKSAVGAAVGLVTSIAKKAALAATAIAAIGTASVVSFASFEKSFAQVRTLVDETQVDTKALSQGLRDLAVTYGVDLKTAVDAAYQAISAGQDPTQVLGFLETSFKGAAGGAATAEQAVDLFTTVLNAFGDTAGNVDQVADVMFATIKAGKTTMVELAASVGRVAPVASAAGVSVQEMGAALAALTASGLSTAEAATALKSTITGVLKPSTEAAVALEAVGISAASLRKEGLGETMRKVAEETRGNAKEIAKLFPSMEALVGVANLAGVGFEKFQGALTTTSEASGAAAQAFGRTSATLASSFAKLQATFVDTFRTLGQALAPVFAGIVDSFRGVADDTREEMKALAEVFETRARSMGDSIRDAGDDIRQRGGLITISLRAVAKAFGVVGKVIDAVKKPISGAISGFDLMGRILKTVLLAAVTAAIAPIRRFLDLITFLPKVLLRAASALSGLVGFDSLSRQLQGAADSMSSITDQVGAFADSMRESTVEAIKTVGDFDKTYVDSVRTFERASGVVRQLGQDTAGFAQEIDAAKLSAQEAKDATTGLGDSFEATGEAAGKATTGIQGASQAAGNLAATFTQGAGAGDQLSRVLLDMGKSAGGAIQGLAGLPKEIQRIVAALQQIGQARTPAQVLEEQRGQLQQLLQQADSELQAAIDKATARGDVQLKAAESARTAALAKVQAQVGGGLVDQRQAAQAIEAINAKYAESVRRVTDVFNTQRDVAKGAFQVVLDEIQKLETGAAAIRDQAIQSASDIGTAAIDEARERSRAAIEAINAQADAGLLGQVERLQALREEEDRLAQQVSDIGERFNRQREAAVAAFEATTQAADTAADANERLAASAKAVEEGYFGLSDTIDAVNRSVTGENLDAFQVYFELYEQGTITAQELDAAILELKLQMAEQAAVARENTAENKLLAEGYTEMLDKVEELTRTLDGPALEAMDALKEAYKEGKISAEELAEGLERLNETVSEEARLKEEATKASLDHAAAMKQEAAAATEVANATERAAARSQAAMARNSAGASFFGIQSSPRAAPGQRRTVTGRPIDESGRPAPRGILSFDRGGPVLRDQIAKVHAGEFVLSRQGVGELGRIMAQLINARRAPAVRISNTFDIEGRPLDNDLRGQARALLPEITRAVRLGVAGKRVL